MIAMWLIHYTLTHIILAPDYHTYFESRKEALIWAEDHGYDLKYIEVLPVIYPEQSGY